MDAIELLKDDHRAVEALLKRIMDTAEDEPAEAGELYEQVRTMIKAHETIEQEIFYPAAREAGEEADEIVAHSFVEHHLVDVLIGEIDEQQPSDEEWCAKVHVLTELISHHVDDEEDELFPAVKKGMEKEQLQELGERMEQRKDELLGEAAGVGAMAAGPRKAQRKPRASRAKPPAKRGGRGNGSRKR